MFWLRWRWAWCSGPLWASPAQAGLYRYMMENRQGGSPLGTLFTIFRTPYLNVVKVLFLTNLKITLGYFLFLVPGIIWGYRYRLVPYLMAENPYLSTGRAMELSRQMMHGEKWHSFLLELSFFGWALLCALTLGIGYLFLQPYMQATFAELYAALRSKALAYGYTDESELGGFVYHQPQTGADRSRGVRSGRHALAAIPGSPFGGVRPGCLCRKIEPKQAVGLPCHRPVFALLRCFAGLPLARQNRSVLAPAPLWRGRLFAARLPGRARWLPPPQETRRRKKQKNLKKGLAFPQSVCYNKQALARGTPRRAQK